MDLAAAVDGASLPGGTGWVATPRARRVAVFGLTTVLVALSTAAVVGSWRQAQVAVSR
jgi:hypothetical protein